MVSIAKPGPLTPLNELLITVAAWDVTVLNTASMPGIMKEIEKFDFMAPVAERTLSDIIKFNQALKLRMLSSGYLSLCFNAFDTLDGWVFSALRMTGTGENQNFLLREIRFQLRLQHVLSKLSY